MDPDATTAAHPSAAHPTRVRVVVLGPPGWKGATPLVSAQRICVFRHSTGIAAPKVGGCCVLRRVTENVGSPGAKWGSAPALATGDSCSRGWCCGGRQFGYVAGRRIHAENDVVWLLGPKGISWLIADQVSAQHAADHLVRHDQWPARAVPYETVERDTGAKVSVGVALSAGKPPLVESQGPLVECSGELDVCLRRSETGHVPVVDLGEFLHDNHLNAERSCA